VLIDASRADAHTPDAPPLAVIASPLGIQTNNYAEYTAVILALERALTLGAREVELVLDSKLVVEQLTGRWKVRHAAIRPLVDRAQALLAQFARWTLRHEPRAANVAADALANLALDDPAAAQQAEEGGRPVASPVRSEPVGRVAVGAAAALIDSNGRVLLVRHGYGRRNWELPGGAALPGEPPDATARRELHEETGLSLDAGRLTGVYFEPNEERLGPLIHFVFRFPWAADLQPAAQPPEIDDIGFWQPDRLPRPSSDFTERRITDALSDEVALHIVASRTWRD
jgi:8-oxo-dGTP diphosphatase